MGKIGIQRWDIISIDEVVGTRGLEVVKIVGSMKDVLGIDENGFSAWEITPHNYDRFFFK